MREISKIKNGDKREMKKWKKRTKILLLVPSFMLLAILSLVCWKKQEGILNILRGATRQEVSSTISESRKKVYGYYGQAISAQMDLEGRASIEENDASAKNIETAITKEPSLVKNSYEIDQQLQAEQDHGYTWEEPMVIQNPYQISPLTAVVLFNTREECKVRFTVKGKTESANISGEVDAAFSHRVPVIGLYPAMDNTVVLELLDESGNVTDSQELTITTDGLPEKLENAVEPIKVSGESAFELTMVYGQRTSYPFAYDCMGDIRWYLSGERTTEIFMLSNDRIISVDNTTYVPSQDKPQTTNLNEIDYLGRTHTIYYVAGGNHHEVIEKEPGGNLLVLTSSLQGHIEDKIEEIDRQTGKVVNELIMSDLFDTDYENMVDWTHLNTVSYQPETDTIIISPRNLESVVKLNWTTKEIQWILCDPRFWEGTEYEKYVLQPEGDFVYQIQQHTAYQLEADLDGNDQTVEISMFDNHYVKVRKSEVLPYFDGAEESYLLVYAVNEKEMTVQQIKKIPVIYSLITSATIYDEESNHIFGMCGHVMVSEDDRRGMNYEFDYDTEELINQYSIKEHFYRSSEMKMDYNDLASPMEQKENYILGELIKPVKVKEEERPETPEQVLSSEDITFHITGEVLYVGTYDHQISQVIFHGKNNTYVYDTTNILLHAKDYLQFYEYMPIPLQDMEADEYEIYVMYQDGFYDTEQSLTIK